MNSQRRTDLRNIAIIAHVDHGKTTLVDAMLKQGGMLGDRDKHGDRVMDSNELERERGITILAKNTAIRYGDITINILDTPGHHDFGGEVERMLKMADGVLLLVDAAEGPLPQTRFVLQKALDHRLAIITAINKIDRKDARPMEVLDEVYDLFIDMGATDDIIDFPVLFTEGREGRAHQSLDDGATDLRHLFDAIVAAVPAPLDTRHLPLRLQVNNLAWDDYVGRIAVGRVIDGTIRQGQSIVIKGDDHSARKGRIMRLYIANELGRAEIESAGSGDIISVAGLDPIAIGDTLCADESIEALPRIQVDEPTLAMHFCVNNGPFAGEDGKLVTSRNLRERLFRESMMNVAIRVEETDATDVFRVVGRGELQLGILVETMRREGYELMLSRPEVVTRHIDGALHEPLECLTIDCEAEHIGAVTELLAQRKAQMRDMTPGDRTRLTYAIPTRGLIGLYSEFLTETRGTGILNSAFEGWIPWQGPITHRRTGVMVSDRTGFSNAYALFHLQPRGSLFVDAGVRVYEGMIVGETPTSQDLNVNCTREKKLTNLRASGKDEALTLTRPRQFSLEQCIEFIRDDELVEVTPQHLRLRKKILAQNQRHRLLHGKHANT